MAEKTYEEWLAAFQRRKVLNSPKQEFMALALQTAQKLGKVYKK
jgi:hypothetical protein